MLGTWSKSDCHANVGWKPVGWPAAVIAFSCPVYMLCLLTVLVLYRLSMIHYLYMYVCMCIYRSSCDALALRWVFCLPACLHAVSMRNEPPFMCLMSCQSRCGRCLKLPASKLSLLFVCDIPAPSSLTPYLSLNSLHASLQTTLCLHRIKGLCRGRGGVDCYAVKKKTFDFILI